ncbi:hypothetical protein ACFCX4_26550 [Kitasatospora sp. NPDC056327]|uniref:hypothetical protein n=1 Tax=Kitasatospora sp. NPDC056327 TaxID=3345785 RepID=UPI0035E13BFF
MPDRGRAAPADADPHRAAELLRQFVREGVRQPGQPGRGPLRAGLQTAEQHPGAPVRGHRHGLVAAPRTEGARRPGEPTTGDGGPGGPGTPGGLRADRPLPDRRRNAVRCDAVRRSRGRRADPAARKDRECQHRARLRRGQAGSGRQRVGRPASLQQGPRRLQHQLPLPGPTGLVVQQVRRREPGRRCQRPCDARWQRSPGRRHPEGAEHLVTGPHRDGRALRDGAVGPAVERARGAPQQGEEAVLAHRRPAFGRHPAGQDGGTADVVDVLPVVGGVGQHPGVRALDRHRAADQGGERLGQRVQVAERHIGGLRLLRHGEPGPQRADQLRPVGPGPAQQDRRAGLGGGRPQHPVRRARALLPEDHPRRPVTAGRPQQGERPLGARVDTDRHHQASRLGTRLLAVEHVQPRHRHVQPQRGDAHLDHRLRDRHHTPQGPPPLRPRTPARHPPLLPAHPRPGPARRTV